MIGHLKMISEKEKLAADKKPELYEDMIYESETEELDDWWDQLSFIYYIWMKKNNIKDVPNPTFQREAGKKFEVGDDLGYGRPFYLTPIQTKEVYNFLSSVDSKELVEYAITQEAEDLVYPHDPQEEMDSDPDYINWITKYMDRVTEYYKKAAEIGYGMLQAVV